MNILRDSINKSLLPALWVLVLMVSVGPFGDTEYTPSLPRIAEEFGVGYGAVQQSMTVYLLAYAMAQLLYGPLSDRIGRKPVALWGALVFTLGSTVCWLSVDLPMLLAGRVLQGLGSCAGSVISSAMVRDAYPKERIQIVYTKINAAFALAPAIGPVVGAFVDDRYGWQANMLILLVLGSLLFLVVLLFAPETRSPETRGPETKGQMAPRHLWRTYRSLFRQRGYLPAILINGLVIGVVYASLTEAPALVTKALGLPSRWMAAVAGGVLVAFLAGSLGGIALQNRLSAVKLLFLGLQLILIGALLQGAMGVLGKIDLASMLLPIMLGYVGIALVVPNAIGIAMRPFGDAAGAASAMLGFSQMGIAALANAGVSLLPMGPVLAIPVMFAILAVLGLMVYGSTFALHPERGSAEMVESGE